MVRQYPTGIIVPIIKNEEIDHDLLNSGENEMSQYDRELKEEGIKEGEKRMLLRLVRKHLSQNKPYEFIKDVLDITDGQLQELKKELDADNT